MACARSWCKRSGLKETQHTCSWEIVLYFSLENDKERQVPVSLSRNLHKTFMHHLHRPWGLNGDDFDEPETQEEVDKLHRRVASLLRSWHSTDRNAIWMHECLMEHGC
jgi:hypothetical protein